MYDGKKGFYFFCIFFVFPSCFPLLSSLTFSCVCFTSPLFIVFYGAFVMCGLFASLSVFLIQMSALEPLYAKCPIGFPNGGDSAGKSQKNAEVILKMIPKKQQSCCEYMLSSRTAPEWRPGRSPGCSI